MATGDGAAVVAGDGAATGGDIGHIRTLEDADVIGDTVADGAAVVAHDAADIDIGVYHGVPDDDVLHRATGAEVAEESLTAGIVTIFGIYFLDTDTADGVALPIEVTPEGAAIATDGGVVVLCYCCTEVVKVVPCVLIAVGDVGGQHEVFAAEVVGTVVGIDTDGHVVELTGAGDDVGVGLSAAAAPGQGDGYAVCLVAAGAGEDVARQVGDGADELAGDERRAEGVGDGAAEGEHVGATAAEVVVVAPVGVEVGCAAHGDHLAERYGDIDGCACAVRAGSHHGVAGDGGGGGVAEGHTHEEVLVAPRVVVVATSIEARGDVRRGDGQDDGAAAVVTTLIFLLVELACAIAELATGGASVGEVDFAFGVAAAGKLETDLIDGVHGVIDLSVLVGASVVGGAAVARYNLEVLVAVVLLLLSEADRGVNLVAKRAEVRGRCARAADERRGADGGGLLGVVVAVVDENVAVQRTAGLRHAAGRETDIHIFAAAHT